ncbi:unnamed protein product [Strongylus vulgaris]|uniref:Uncharacterized protein n=1 Tax=Strongylus vulgaris TaxID=40348 RepID=A0A3P7JMA4_STRVU|nr:unnamed protein product [Strongylus vulgaris]
MQLDIDSFWITPPIQSYEDLADLLISSKLGYFRKPSFLNISASIRTKVVALTKIPDPEVEQYLWQVRSVLEELKKETDLVSGQWCPTPAEDLIADRRVEQ